MLKFQKPINLWVVSTLVLAVFLALSLATNVILSLKSELFPLLGIDSKYLTGIDSSFVSPIKSVSAEDVYPLFKCPCCGKVISKCSCPMAKERKEYIDSLTEKETSEYDIIFTYIKKYGLDSLEDGDKRKEIREELLKTAPSDRPIISLTPYFHDLGDVSQKKGKVYTYFDLKNEGKSDLVIDRLETSCGCTFASVVFGGEEGPLFSMPGHGKTPQWDGITIPPGKSAQLKVMYDPNVHKDFRGAAIREILVFSNDPVDFEKKVRIELNQVD